MSERVSAAQRVQIAHRAEEEIMRYARPDPETGLRPHAIWHKHVHNVTLDPVQVLKMIEMDQNPNTIDVSCRRTGKTAVKEMYLLEHLATMAHQDLGIVAPRLQQSQNNLAYHLDAIDRSEILAAYIGYKNGRKQKSDTGYQFYNRSGAWAYGIMSQVDGDSLTAASLEETDDMPAQRLLGNFLPMLGSARRLGADPAKASFKPQVRITGVFKGADVLQTLLDTKQYHQLPSVDVYLGIELGILNAEFMMQMREQMPEGEYIRQFLCRNVASQNFLWETYIRRALGVGLQSGLTPAQPMPGERYKRRGIITFGYDHTGHGENPAASKSTLVVCEQISNFVTFPYVKSWGAGTDDKVIENDLLAAWRYFMPDGACGDAYGVGMLTSLNDRLYAEGLTDIDRRSIGDGHSNASTWADWPFAPIRFEGMVKHSMASALRAAFHNGHAAIPYFYDGYDAVKDAANTVWRPGQAARGGSMEDVADWLLFVRQLGNIKQESTKASYPSYKMADPKQGDDFFDAAMAGVWKLNTRGATLEPAAILTKKTSRAQLLGNAA